MLDSEPNWHLLPHNPSQFFELSNSSDVRDLKRAYNRLLRQYKPEKFPGEFQRIREAYETLSEWLRYGGTVSQSPSPSTFQPEGVHPDCGQTTSSDTAGLENKTPIVNSFRDRLHCEPIAMLYRELGDGPCHSAQDYIMLAFMADVTARDKSSKSARVGFADWILRGLQAFPRNSELIALLRELLLEYHDRPATRNLLLRLAELAKEDFFYITERVWGRLIDRLPFSEFQKLLGECEDRLGAHSDMSQLIFYVYLLRSSVWKADEDWWQGIWKHLDDNFFKLPHWEQGEVDFADNLRQYQKCRSEFASICPLAAEIDHVIEGYCLSPESEGDWQVLQCQSRISQRGFFLISDFPDQSADSGRQDLFLAVWDKILSEVHDRLGDNSELSGSTGELQHKMEHTLIRANIRWAKTSTSRQGNFIVLVGIIQAILIMTATVSYLVRSVRSFMDIGMLQGFWDICLAIVSVVLGLPLAMIVAYYGVRKSRMHYGHVRHDLILLLRAAPLNEPALIEFIQAAEGKKVGDDTVSDTSSVVKGLQTDYAVRLFCRAMMTLARY